MTDHSNMALGKRLGVVHDPRTLELAKYVSLAALPEPPKSVRHSDSVLHHGGYPMFANDRLGDCTCATAGHMELTWSHGQVRLTDSDVIRAYSDITGYPQKGDNGAYELDVLNYWRNVGFAGRKLYAFARCDWRDREQLRAACWLFGGVYCGAGLPIAAQRQEKWDVRADVPLSGDWSPGSWGGHAFHIADVDEHGVTVVTWGERKRVSFRWLDAYMDEAYALISPEWLHHAHGTRSPQGFDLAALEADLALLHR